LGIVTTGERQHHDNQILILLVDLVNELLISAVRCKFTKLEFISQLCAGGIVGLSVTGLFELALSEWRKKVIKKPSAR
jgi:3-dehydroquinate dehydratase